MQTWDGREVTLKQGRVRTQDTISGQPSNENDLSRLLKLFLDGRREHNCKEDKKVEGVKPVKSMFDCNQEEVVWFFSESLIDTLEMSNILNLSLENTCIRWNNSWLLSLGGFAFKSRSYELAQILSQGHRSTVELWVYPTHNTTNRAKKIHSNISVGGPKWQTSSGWAKDDVLNSPCGWKTSFQMDVERHPFILPVTLWPGDLCFT